MPTDPSRIPALEEELRQARGTKPGGQAPRKSYIAAIEAELRLHRAAAEPEAPKETAVAEAPKDNADAKPSKRAENADAASAPETADA